MSRRGFVGAMLSWLPGGTGTAALGVRSAMSSLRNPPGRPKARQKLQSKQYTRVGVYGGEEELARKAAAALPI